MSDKNIGQLISKSLRMTLSAEESRQVKEHLSTNEHARRFAQLSGWIQDSVSFAARTADADDGSNPALSAAAKARLRNLVAGAVAEKNRRSQSGQLPEVRHAAKPKRKPLFPDFGQGGVGGRDLAVAGVFKVACRGEIVRRSLLFAAVVGTILVAINHGRCIAMGRFDSACFASSALTVIVIYIVSTAASVLAVASKRQ